jgi:hypothetical protein
MEYKYGLPLQYGFWDTGWASTMIVMPCQEEFSSGNQPTAIRKIRLEVDMKNVLPLEVAPACPLQFAIYSNTSPFPRVLMGTLRNAEPESGWPPAVMTRGGA